MVLSVIGYPYNLDFDYGALGQLQHFSINNLGDPFIESNYGVHSRQFEVGVLDWFARLWEIEKSEYWGYITNCGTEGNLHGILVGLVDFSCFFLNTKELNQVLEKSELLMHFNCAGGKCFLMEFSMHLENRIILSSKLLECIEWVV
jgi:hypothetical protein